MNFKQVGGDSWVILSPIEQSIKKKIESVGVPLKDWDIQINYGIKTGYNDAFIITTEKRDEILSNCKTPAERKRTEQIIRPILRGRDIKRYGYNWAEIYLIALFPSRCFDIKDYPAVEQYLLEFEKERLLENGLPEIANKKILLHEYCRQRLEQTGKNIIINGKTVIIDGTVQKSRKKTTNQWFETQDSISYWEDFFRPKIVWNRIAAIKQFAVVKEGVFIQDSMHFIVGKQLNYLCSVLNSKIIQWLLDTTIGLAAGGNAGNSDNIRNLYIPYTKSDKPITDIDLYQQYGLTNTEIQFIESQQKQDKEID